MPRVCTVCTHPDRQEIDAVIVAGTPNRRIATHHGLTEAAVRRHRAMHLPTGLVQARAAAELATADNLLDQLVTLYREALAVLDRAKAGADERLALQAVREASRVLELQARLLGELRAPARPHEVKDGEPLVTLEAMDALLAAMRADRDASGARLLPAPGNGSTW